MGFCFAQLAASAPSTEDLQQHQEPAGVYEHGGDGGGGDKYPSAVPPTTPAASGTFKDKLKNIVTSVKEGASGAYESVSDSVSGAAHKLDEKRKEAVAGTKKVVNSFVDKIKQSFKGGDNDDGGHDHSAGHEVSASVQQQAAEANDYAQSASKNNNN